MSKTILYTCMRLYRSLPSCWIRLPIKRVFLVRLLFFSRTWRSMRDRGRMILHKSSKTVIEHDSLFSQWFVNYVITICDLTRCVVAEFIEFQRRTLRQPEFSFSLAHTVCFCVYLQTRKSIQFTDFNGRRRPMPNGNNIVARAHHITFRAKSHTKIDGNASHWEK